MKNYIIIGGNRGIGEVIVGRLLEQEANVHHFSRFSTEGPKDLGSLYHPTKFDATKDEFDFDLRLFLYEYDLRFQFLPLQYEYVKEDWL